MAGFITSGALLLIVLIGSSFGYPSKMAPAEVSEPQPEAAAVSVQPVAVSQGTSIPAPPSHVSTPLGGFQPAAAQDVAWAVQPLSLLSGADSGPVASVAGPHGYATYPQYHGGDASQYEGSYEQGNSESETHGQGYSSHPVAVHAPADNMYVSESQPLGFGAVGGFGSWPAFTNLYDYMFMTGQYPPGTLTHSSSSFEQGADHWHDVHFQRYYIPTYTITELQPATVRQAPAKGQNVKQTSGKEY